MGITLILLTKPFYICKSVFICGVQTMFIVAHTLVELARTSITVHLNMFHKTLICTIALISLPLRVLNALQRERLLQDTLLVMQMELDNLAWDREELQHQLHTAIKECRILKSMLAEVEDENDSIIAKFELLEGELQDLKVENLQLKDLLGKENWSFKVSHDAESSQNIGIAISGGSQYSNKGGKMMLEEEIMHKDVRGGECKSGAEFPSFIKAGSVTRGSIPSNSHSIASPVRNDNTGLDKGRDVALSQSLFSTMLSLLVGIIIWKAENPCMPLVGALFAVVALSLRSAFQFFSNIKNKTASDAVALLSFNCFILGSVTYPALPGVAQMFAPLAVRLSD